MSWIREQEANDAFLLREEMRDMANFKKIGKRVVNLDRVESLYFQPQGGMSHDAPCVVIDFGGADNYIAIYKRSEPETFSALMTWMDERPMLLSDEE